MSGNASDIDVECDFCKKSLTQATLLRHIGQTQACKDFYGPRFKKMKTEKATLRKEKWRDNLTAKESKKNRKKQKMYAKKPDSKEKKKIAMRKWRQIQAEEKKKEAEEKRKTLDDKNDQDVEGESSVKILYKTTENFQDIFDESWIKCHFCLEKFDLLFILKHIGANKECKCFYGPKFDEFKKEKNRIKMRVYREETGNKREKEKYKSNKEVQEKKRQSSKKANQVLKEKKSLFREKEKKEYNSKEAEESLDYQTKKFQERNLMGKTRFDWVGKCFLHFFETFDDINIRVQKQLLELVHSIEETFQKNEKKIQEIAETVKDASHISEVHGAFSIGPDIEIQLPWQNLERSIGGNLEQILAGIENAEKTTDWHSVFEKIYDTYTQNYTGCWWHHWKKGDYLPTPFDYLPCIICKNKPNCLEKPKKLESIIRTKY